MSIPCIPIALYLEKGAAPLQLTVANFSFARPRHELHHVPQEGRRVIAVAPVAGAGTSLQHLGGRGALGEDSLVFSRRRKGISGEGVAAAALMEDESGGWEYFFLDIGEGIGLIVFRDPTRRLTDVGLESPLSFLAQRRCRKQIFEHGQRRGVSRVSFEGQWAEGAHYVYISCSVAVGQPAAADVHQVYLSHDYGSIDLIVRNRGGGARLTNWGAQL